MRYLGISCLFVVLLFVVPSFAKDLVWTANTEPDLKKYHVYLCKVKGCTATDQGQLWVGEVPHDHTLKPAQYSFPIPSGIEGAAVVTAEDTGGLVSTPSNMVSFSTILNLPPAAPTGLTSR